MKRPYFVVVFTASIASTLNSLHWLSPWHSFLNEEEREEQELSYQPWISASFPESTIFTSSIDTPFRHSNASSNDRKKVDTGVIEGANTSHPKTTLWIVTCATTRTQKTNLFRVMWQSATAFQRLNNNYLNSDRNTNDDKRWRYDVRVENVCRKRKRLHGMTTTLKMIQFTTKLLLTKIERSATGSNTNVTNVPAVDAAWTTKNDDGEFDSISILNFLANLDSYRISRLRDFNKNTELVSGKWKDRIEKIYEIARAQLNSPFSMMSAPGHGLRGSMENSHSPERDYVIFVNSSSVVNTWSSATAEDLIKDYDRVRGNTHSIVIGGDINRYLGNEERSPHPYEPFYSSSARKDDENTRCPHYADSALYMGPLLDIWKMLVDWASMDIDSAKWNTHFTSLVAAPDLEQDRATIWYSLNTEKAVLDTSASIFRNMNGFYNCTLSGGCPRNGGHKEGVWDDQDFSFGFVQVPSYAASARPFILSSQGLAGDLLESASKAFGDTFDGIRAQCKEHGSTEGRLCYAFDDRK